MLLSKSFHRCSIRKRSALCNIRVSPSVRSILVITLLTWNRAILSGLELTTKWLLGLIQSGILRTVRKDIGCWTGLSKPCLHQGSWLSVVRGTGHNSWVIWLLWRVECTSNNAIRRALGINGLIQNVIVIIVAGMSSKGS